VSSSSVDPVVAAGRATAIATIRALANDSEADCDALSSLLDETDTETLRATVEELGFAVRRHRQAVQRVPRALRHEGRTR
jgi:hypothetical protein